MDRWTGGKRRTGGKGTADPFSSPFTQLSSTATQPATHITHSFDSALLPCTLCFYVFPQKKDKIFCRAHADTYLSTPATATLCTGSMGLSLLGIIQYGLICLITHSDQKGPPQSPPLGRLGRGNGKEWGCDGRKRVELTPSLLHPLATNHRPLDGRLSQIGIHTSLHPIYERECMSAILLSSTVVDGDPRKVPFPSYVCAFHSLISARPSVIKSVPEDASSSLSLSRCDKRRRELISLATLSESINPVVSQADRSAVHYYFSDRKSRENYLQAHF